MELGARRPLDAMGRPDPASAPERDVVGWVPVPGEEHWKALVFECFDYPVELWDHLVPILYGECAAGTKIDLDIHNQQCQVR
jgi:hypothetical protein